MRINNLTKTISLLLFLLVGLSSFAFALSASDQALIEKSQDLQDFKQYLLSQGVEGERYFGSFKYLVVDDKSSYFQTGSNGELLVKIAGDEKNHWLGATGINTLVLDSKGNIVIAAVRKWNHDYEFLGQLKHLWAMYMTSNGKAGRGDVTLKGFPAIEDISFRFAGLSGITLDITSDNLRVLNLSNNYLKTINGLKTCASLLYLDLGDTQVATLPGLEDLHQLHWLRLSCCEKLTELTDMRNLPELRKLEISTTAINSLPHIGELQKIETLNMARTNISPQTPLPASL